MPRSHDLLTISLNTSIDAGIRNRYHCLVAGVEKANCELHATDIHSPFEKGVVLWIVGKKEDVERVMENCG